MKDRAIRAWMTAAAMAAALVAASFAEAQSKKAPPKQRAPNPMAHAMALQQPPPADVARALSTEQAAIRDAAAKSPQQAQPLVQLLVARVAAKTGRDPDPSLFGWIIQAVQVVRVMAAYAPGGAVYNQLPDFVKPGLNGSLAQGFVDVGKVDSLAKAGKVDEAVRILRQNFSQTDSLLSPVLVTATPRQSADLLRTFDFQFDLAQSLAKRAPSNGGAVETGFASAALRKARILELERRIAAGIFGSQDKSLQLAQGAWITSRTLIAQIEFQRAYGVTPTPAQEQDLAKLRALHEQMGTVLASKAKSSRSADASFDLDTVISSLRRALPAGDKLLSYVRYGDDSKEKPAGYAAYVLDAKDLSFTDLGAAAAIDAAIGSYTEALDMLDSSSDSLRRKEALAKTLYGLVYAPVSAALAGTTSIRVAADGALQLVPLSALHDGKDWLLARASFSYLSSEREMLGSHSPASGRTAPVVATWSPKGAGRNAPPKGQPLTPEHFERLDGVAREAQVVSALLPNSRVFDGSAATDWQLLKVGAPGVLHVAAHGIFLGGNAAGAGGRGVVLATAPAGKRAPADTLTVDPLIRSALVFAPNAKPATDGFLTGYEVALMNLFGTELVVLSACESGRGAATRTEGVRGLRAAFSAAGAQSLIVSLWHVRDEPTVNLMRDLYSALAKKRGRREALQEAMLAARKRSPDPSLWAAFVLLGNTGPLATFGAAPPPAVAHETPAKRADRATAFQAMEAGRSARGTGAWQFGKSKETLKDYYVQGNLGPDGKNLRVNLVGEQTMFSFFVENYRGTGTYRLGARTARAGMGFKSRGSTVDPSSLDPDGDMGAVTAGTITLTGGGNAPLVGRFLLKLGKSDIPGSFVLPATH